MPVYNLDFYNVFYAYKWFGEGVGGGISVCRSTRCFKTHVAIKVSAPRSNMGFDIKLIYFAMQHLVADV
jgi:hypothetical protein